MDEMLRHLNSQLKAPITMQQLNDETTQVMNSLLCLNISMYHMMHNELIYHHETNKTYNAHLVYKCATNGSYDPWNHEGSEKFDHPPPELEPPQVLYEWTQADSGDVINRLFTGEKVLLYADATLGDKLPSSASRDMFGLRAHHLEMVFKAVDQDRFDSLFSRFWMETSYIGRPQYRIGNDVYVTSDYFWRITINSHKNCDHLYSLWRPDYWGRRGDIMISPFALWTIQLKGRYPYMDDEPSQVWRQLADAAGVNTDAGPNITLLGSLQPGTRSMPLDCLKNCLSTYNHHL